MTDTTSRNKRAILAKAVTRAFDEWRLPNTGRQVLLGLGPNSRTTLGRYAKGHPLTTPVISSTVSEICSESTRAFRFCILRIPRSGQTGSGSPIVASRMYTDRDRSAIRLGWPADGAIPGRPDAQSLTAHTKGRFPCNPRSVSSSLSRSLGSHPQRECDASGYSSSSRHCSRRPLALSRFVWLEKDDHATWNRYLIPEAAEARRSIDEIFSEELLAAKNAVQGDDLPIEMARLFGISRLTLPARKRIISAGKST